MRRAFYRARTFFSIIWFYICWRYILVLNKLNVFILLYIIYIYSICCKKNHWKNQLCKTTILAPLNTTTRLYILFLHIYGSGHEVHFIAAAISRMPAYLLSSNLLSLIGIHLNVRPSPCATPTPLLQPEHYDPTITLAEFIDSYSLAYGGVTFCPC